MAKIKPASYIEGISGKVCRHSQDEFRTNSSSGTIVLSKKCNPYTGEATEKQIAQRSVFKSRVQVVSQWLKDNGPSDTNGTKGTDLYQEAMELKKSYGKASVNAVLFMYQTKTSPYAVTLPSEGGTRQDTTSGSSGGDSAGENSGVGGI